MTIVANSIHGDYQLANGHGHDKAQEVLKVAPTFPVLLLLFILIFIFLKPLYQFNWMPMPSLIEFIGYISYGY